jgi:hypothetical protein
MAGENTTALKNEDSMHPDSFKIAHRRAVKGLGKFFPSVIPNKKYVSTLW